MIDDWDIRPTPTPSAGPAVNVSLVVPLPSDMGGRGEILAFSAFGTLKLPTGVVQQGETSLKAARRVALGTIGLSVLPDRLVYVLEQSGRELLLCMLCSLDPGDDAEPKPGMRFVRLDDPDAALEPAALREVLVEDLRGGFVRPTAHIIVAFDAAGRERIDVHW